MTFCEQRRTWAQINDICTFARKASQLWPWIALRFEFPQIFFIDCYNSGCSRIELEYTTSSVLKTGGKSFKISRGILSLFETKLSNARIVMQRPRAFKSKPPANNRLSTDKVENWHWWCDRQTRYDRLQVSHSAIKLPIMRLRRPVLVNRRVAAFLEELQHTPSEFRKLGPSHFLYSNVTLPRTGVPYLKRKSPIELLWNRSHLPHITGRFPQTGVLSSYNFHTCQNKWSPCS